MSGRTFILILVIIGFFAFSLEMLISDLFISPKSSTITLPQKSTIPTPSHHSPQASQKPPAEPPSISPVNYNPTWMLASGYIWPGVKLYYGTGDDKRLMGEVVDWSEHYRNPVTGKTMRAVLVRMRSGSLEWKDRDWLISNIFVRTDDPVLK